MIEIKNVMKVLQNEQEVFYFSLSAEELLQIIKVEHFGVNAQGVNRKFDFKHAQDISEFMGQPDSLLLEPITVYVDSDWEYDEKTKVLRGKRGGQLVLEEGQHRVGALQFLSSKDKKFWNMLIVATKNMELNQRLNVFAQQRFRKVLDPRFMLQILHKTGSLDSQTKDAYEMLLKLNSDEKSPLRNKILITEKTPSAAIPSQLQKQLLSILPDLPLASFLREESSKLKGNSLLKYLRRDLFSSYSSIRDLDFDLQYRCISRLLSAASRRWKEPWVDQKRHFLFSIRGIGGLLELIVVGENFKRMLIRNWEYKNLEQALESMDYNWSKIPFKEDPARNLPTALEIAHGLDFSLFEKGRKVKAEPQKAEETD